MSQRPSESVDGRLGRSLRSRRAISEACLDLIEEGVLQPSADQIAARSGVSRRSIFNHFGDLAELYDAVVEAGLQRCAPLLKPVDADASLARRLDGLVEARTRFLEATSPVTRSLTAQLLVGPVREQAWRVSQDALREQQRDVERLFGDDLGHLADEARRETLEAMSAALAPLSWEYLRHSRGLPMARARAVVRRTLAALLRDAGLDPGPGADDADPDRRRVPDPGRVG